MALPKINDKPKYELTIPSTGKSVRYRPYLVREEKILMMAMESQDKKAALNAIVDTITACVDEDLNKKDLTIFDIEYMFIKIRSKSIGETTTIGLKCKSCDSVNEVQVNLDDVKIKSNKEVNKEILVDGDINITLKMKWPQFYDVVLIEEDKKLSETERTFKLIAKCMESLSTDDEIFLLKDETEEEVMRFIDSLNNDQFNKIKEFVQNMPRAEKEIEYTCTSCAHENKIMLRGIDDFF